MKKLILSFMLLCGMVAQASTGLTDYSGMLVADLPTHGDASEALQALIDECPNMTASLSFLEFSAQVCPKKTVFKDYFIR